MAGRRWTLRWTPSIGEWIAHGVATEANEFMVEVVPLADLQADLGKRAPCGAANHSEMAGRRTCTFAPGHDGEHSWQVYL
jgi:hypothetical protein